MGAVGLSATGCRSACLRLRGVANPYNKGFLVTLVIRVTFAIRIILVTIDNYPNKKLNMKKLMRILPAFLIAAGICFSGFANE